MLDDITDVIKDVSEVKKTDIMFCFVSRREVMNKDYNRILNNLEMFKKAGKDGKGKLFLIFDGFDDDEREIYMIPEIRDFVKNIYDKYKYLFYFLTTLDNNRSIIFACINDFRSIQKDYNKVSLEIIFDEKIKKDTINAMLEYGKLIGEEEMQRVIFTFI